MSDSLLSTLLQCMQQEITLIIYVGRKFKNQDLTPDSNHG